MSGSRILTGTFFHPDEPDTCPSRFRAQHDEIERAGSTSVHDRYAAGWKVGTNLETLYKRGAITLEMKEVGELFGIRFYIAGLEPLHASNLTRPINDIRPRYEASDRSVWAKDYVWSRISAVGGITSIPGDLTWHVLGFQLSLRQWALQWARDHLPVTEAAAKGVLISVLATLALNSTSCRWEPPRYRPPVADGTGKWPRVRAWAPEAPAP
jgi:hypothetical protein